MARTHRNPRIISRKLADEIEPRRYQTNVSLNQPPTRAADRPVREYVTNVNWGERMMGTVYLIHFETPYKHAHADQAAGAVVARLERCAARRSWTASYRPVAQPLKRPVVTQLVQRLRGA
jgi:hypothetical protein